MIPQNKLTPDRIQYPFFSLCTDQARMYMDDALYPQPPKNELFDLSMSYLHENGRFVQQTLTYNIILLTLHLQLGNSYVRAKWNTDNIHEVTYTSWMPTDILSKRRFCPNFTMGCRTVQLYNCVHLEVPGESETEVKDAVNKCLI
jgi:hypothetical protein